MWSRPNNDDASSGLENSRLGLWLTDLSRPAKRNFLMFWDAAVLSSSLWIAMVLRYGIVDFPRGERLDGLYFILPILGVIIYWYLGLYRSMLRSMESQTIQIIAFGAFVMSLLIAAYTHFDVKILIPRSIPLVYGLLVIVGVGTSRFLLKEIYRVIHAGPKSIERVVIYGAGIIGTQLAAMLQNAPEYTLVGFLDDDPSLKGVRVRGRTVYDLEGLKKLRAANKFDQIFLAINNISPSHQRQTIRRLASFNVPLKSIPRVADLLEDGEGVKQFKKLEIRDLLGRQVVAPIDGLIETGIRGKRVMVTGAAGSIGSEICRQIIMAEPAVLIAFDIGELGLYNLENTLQELAGEHKVKFQIRLGSVQDRNTLDRIIGEHGIQLIYHAAAYKHVPIVEENIFAAIENNAFGTKTVAEAAIHGKVERFIFISTDKAVRPTNVMGATKRLAELIVQDMQSKSSDTILTMVRFGNVLGSSGSVIPLFEKQIKQGGPVTLTHKDVTRYFMTINEAAELVLQAGFLAKGGEVFLLDMGNPVKLIDLAELMIQLSGNQVQNGDNDVEGIEIEEIGLRPGEKLYEELLIGQNATGTVHSKIMQAEEDKITSAEMQKLLTKLNKALIKGDEKPIIDQLKLYASLTREKTD